jgi:enamine deaminase RidA (YjgF/YER057c/UK114 family)
VSLAGSGEVVDPGNMERQTRTAMANVERVLAPFDRGLDDLVRLTAFYEAGAGDPSAHIAAALGGREATVGLVPLPFLAYRDMVVEIEAVAAWT